LLRDINRDKIFHTHFSFQNDFVIENQSSNDILITMLGVEEADDDAMPPHLQPEPSRDVDYIYTIYVRAGETVNISGFPKAVFSVYIVSGEKWQPYLIWFGEPTYIGFLMEAVRFKCEGEHSLDFFSSGSGCESQENLIISDDLLNGDSFESIQADQFPELEFQGLP
jgi:hypothetical protein